MQSAQVARVGNGTATHDIRGGEWHYDAQNYTACGFQATGVEHHQSETPIAVTCRRCPS